MNEADLFGGHIIFLLSGERVHVTAASHPRSQLVCYPNRKTMEIIINN